MKILHCIAQRPNVTGSGIYFRQLVKGLHDKGYTNGLVYACQDQDEADLPDHAAAYPVRFKSDDLPFAMPGMSDEMPYDSTVYSEMSADQWDQWQAAFRQTLVQAKADFQPDLVISHHIFALTSLVVEVFDSLPIMGICHGTDLRQVLMNPQLKDAYASQADQLDAYVSLGPADSRKLVDLFGVSADKILAAGGGYNAEVFQTDWSKKSKPGYQLVFAGKIAQSKGVYEVAKALPIILDQEPHCCLLVVGNASDSQKEKLVDLAGSSKAIDFMQALPQEDYAQVLQATDIFLLPSYYEGLGLSAIEALAAGCRVVSSENENLKWLLKDSVLQSGVIDFVDLPRLKNTDTPVGEDLPAYVDRLAQAVLKQIKQIDKEGGARSLTWPQDLTRHIQSLSWQGIIKQIDQQIQELI